MLPELERELQKQSLTLSFRNVKLRLSELSVDGAIKGSAMQIIQRFFTGVKDDSAIKPVLMRAANGDHSWLQRCLLF
ncbi:MAG: hypothetical protein LBD31_10735 [Treponema sp.]|nr:hypothetical protein [Treponema sp.]